MKDIKKFASGETTADEFRDDAARYPIYFLYLGAGQLVAVYLAIVGFLYVGDYAAQETRERYLQALLKQSIGGLEEVGVGKVMSVMTDGVYQMQASISDKAVSLIMAISTVIASIVISLVAFWRLALISMSSLVAILIVLGLCGRFVGIFTTKSIDAHAQAADVAEEVVSSINIVKALGAYDKLAVKFENRVAEGARFGFKARLAMGFLIGGFLAIVMLNVGLNLWQGSREIVELSTSISTVSTIVLSILIGTFTLVTLSPLVATIASGVAAGVEIFTTIDRESHLDPFSQDGETLETVNGDIDFKGLTFAYPLRPEAMVLRNVTFNVPAGTTTAIVGASGSGKSSLVNLLERFYEPNSGIILLDGCPIEELNLRWLRQQIALVDQEPVLFTATVRDNIAKGLFGSPFEEASEQDITNMVIEAAKDAGAHDFIMSLSQGYDTILREGGKALSGGQRQRVAISRAIIRKPKILLLDEPTSALDTISEKHFQDALSLASADRTTIIIAHRLSTIRHADKIVVMGSGRVLEEGTHEQLVSQQGAYHSLLRSQYIGDTPEESSTFSDQVQPLGEMGWDTTTTLAMSSGPSRKGTPALLTHHESSSDLARMSEDVSDDQAPDHIVDKDGKMSLVSLVRFIFSMNRKLWHFMLLGLVTSVISGAGTPVHVIFLANGIASLSLPPSQFGKLRSDINFWSAMYILLAGVLFIVNIIQGFAFGRASQRLTFSLKEKIFKLLLKQENAFFDRHESISSLITLMNNDPMALGFVCNQIIGTFAAVCTTNLAAIGIAIGYGWKLGLVATATIPILLLCGFLRIYLLVLVEQRAKSTNEASAVQAREAINTIRTVASLSSESNVLDSYHKLLSKQRQANFGWILSISALYTPSVSLFFACMALIFWYGTKLLADREYTVLQLWVCFVEVMFSTQTATAAFAHAPDIAKAQTAAYRIKSLFTYSRSNEVPPGRSSWPPIQGGIEINNVSFAYPSRPSRKILKKISLSITPGQYVAFVGPSGCGKTTMLSLLERFYSPTSGQISIDGMDIATLDAEMYRSHIALVSQEVGLFQGTVRENICLGVTSSEPPTEDEIMQACREANILDLVLSLP